MEISAWGPWKPKARRATIRSRLLMPSTTALVWRPLMKARMPSLCWRMVRAFGLAVVENPGQRFLEEIAAVEFVVGALYLAESTSALTGEVAPALEQDEA